MPMREDVELMSDTHSPETLDSAQNNEENVQFGT